MTLNDRQVLQRGLAQLGHDPKRYVRAVGLRRVWIEIRIAWYRWERSNHEHLVARREYEMSQALADRAFCDDQVKRLRGAL